MRIHLIAQSHLDPVFMWPWQEGLASTLNTCREAARKLSEYPSLKFIRSEALPHTWINEHDPELMEQVQGFARQGRWIAVGPWWVQADTNLPAGESLIRQALQGTQECVELLGQRSDVAYLVDSFGHPATLPKVLVHCGFHYFVFSRPGEKYMDLPAALFRWQADDGSSVLSYRIPISYCTYADEVNRVNEVMQSAPDWLDEMMCFFGLGDHGGGPTDRQIRSLIDYSKHPEAPDLIFSEPRDFFTAVELNPDIPEYSGSLAPFAVGCYSAAADLKRQHDLAQAELLDTEAFVAVASAMGLGLPKGVTPLLRQCWRDLLFTQFHDLLPGSSIREGLAHAKALAGSVHAKAGQLKALALTKVAAQIDTQGSGYIHLVVFNSADIDRTVYFEYEPWLFWQDWEAYDLVDEDGRSVAHQQMQAEAAAPGLTRLMVKLNLPAHGYQSLRVTGPEPDLSHLSVPADRDMVVSGKMTEVVDTPRYRLKFDKHNGSILAAYHKPTKRDLCRTALLDAVVLEDRSDTWSMDRVSYHKSVGRFADPITLELENGPLMWCARTARKFGRSRLEQEIRLFDANDLVEVRNRLFWQEPWAVLKLLVPSPFGRSRLRRGLAFGSAYATEGVEFCFQNWLLLEPSDGNGADRIGGLAVVVGPGIHGADFVDNTLRITLVRSPLYCHEELNRRFEPGPRHQHMDLLEHETILGLLPVEKGVSIKRLVELSHSLTVPTPVVTSHCHAGALPATGSLFHVEPEHVAVSAVKLSEDRAGYVVRLWETAGKPANGVLFWLGAEIPFTVSANAILSMKLTASRAGWLATEVNGLEEPLQQPVEAAGWPA